MLGASSMDMGGGDIWSTGAFSFESSLKDLLDSDSFTMEQLLAEDELLQEMRGLHQKLIEYLSKPQSVTKLVQYVILSREQLQDKYCQPLEIATAAVGLNGGNTEHTIVDKPTEPIEWLRQHLEESKRGDKSKEPEKDPALKYIRFPYMACEIICCEIPEILETLVKGPCIVEGTEIDSTEIVTTDSQTEMVEIVSKAEGQQLTLLDLLFSVLHDTKAGDLDDYRAGYLDKILTVLFRKRPEEMTAFINSGGLAGREKLMESMLKHLYSPSIMQIAQRLLLPRRPMEQPQEQQGDEIVAGDDDEGEKTFRCDWLTSTQVLELLMTKLIGPDRNQTATEDEKLLDMSLNAAEVLITIIQNSMLSSPTILSLTTSETISRIIDAATTLSGDYFSPHESLLTSAMNVLESLILQLGGYGAVGTMTLLPEAELSAEQQEERRAIFEEDSPDPPSGSQEVASSVESPPTPTAQAIAAVKAAARSDLPEEDEEEEKEDQYIADLSTVLEHLPLLLERLSALLTHPSTKKWLSPTQFSHTKPLQMLGNSRLRIVRVLESLVLLGDPDIDSKLVQSDCLSICLDFFWQFQWCSMLHQSVANLLVHVFEGQNTRYEMQEYFLVKCNLLGRLMDSFVDREAAHIARRPNEYPPSDDVSPNEPEAPFAVSEDDVEAAMETEKDDVECSVEQVATEAARTESQESSSVDEGNHVTLAQTFRHGYMGHVIIICQALVHAYSNEGELEEENTENIKENGTANQDVERGEGSLNASSSGPNSTDGEPIGPKDDFGEPLLLFEVVYTHPLADRWHDFVETTLAAETNIQSTPLGGFNAPSTGVDPMHGRRPGLADEGYMLGDDGEGPPAPPRGLLGSDIIDMDDNDLDMAASMMASLSIGRPSKADGDDDSDSGRSYNSGGTAGSEKSAYAFDDPLGKTGGLGIELGRLGEYSDAKKEDGQPSATAERDDDDGSHSSSDEEPEPQQSGDSDVPVMDLFAGNFNYNDQPAEITEVDASPPFADFADFGAAGPDGDGDFGPFAEAAPVNLPDSGTTADLDDIFGKGDHAELLEQDDFAEDSFESAPQQSDESPAEGISGEDVTPAEDPAEASPSPLNQDELPSATSDVLQSDPVTETPEDPDKEEKPEKESWD